MIPGERMTPKAALSAMLPVLCVLLVLFAAVADHAQVRKIDTAEPRVFSLLSRIRDPLSGNPNCGFRDGLTIANRILHSDSQFPLDSEASSVDTRQVCAG